MIRLHKRTIPALAAAFVVCTLTAGMLDLSLTTFAQNEAGNAASTANARQFLDQLRLSTGTPAISGAVALHGKIVYSDGVGLIDLEHRTPATGVSVYNIGSVSKIVTAIAVMQLLEEKRISLDDDIRTYVPSFPDKGVKITIRHLLTQTSGIRHYHNSDFPGTPDNENIQPITSYLDGLKFFANDPLLFQPGEFYFYTSYGVNLLQGVVEKASGLPFEQYLQEHIWRPAGMTSASLDIPERIVPNRAMSYRIEKGQTFNYYYNDLRYKFASGGMIASAEDLVKFGEALNHGVFMDPNTRSLMLSSQLSGKKRFREDGAPVEIGFEQGMLWQIHRDAAGRRVAYMCGSIKGSNACLVDFIDEDLVAAVATNSWECCGWSKAESLAAFFRASIKPTKTP
jgi:CubicO group peptidase (beta-lactamase class C family)